MPSRNFCDLCDDLIQEPNSYWNVEILEAGQSALSTSILYTDNSDSENVRRYYIDIRRTVHRMICRKCSEKLTVFIEHLKKNKRK